MLYAIRWEIQGVGELQGFRLPGRRDRAGYRHILPNVCGFDILERLGDGDTYFVGRPCGGVGQEVKESEQMEDRVSRRSGMKETIGLE